MISEASKILLFLMVVFLAGYLLAINDVSKKQKEGFDATEVVLRQADVYEEDPNMIVNRIDSVYKDVYGTNMPADKLRDVVQTYDLKTYSDEAYRKMLLNDLRSDHVLTVKNTFGTVLNRLPTSIELEKYVKLFMEKNLTSAEQLEALLSSGPEAVGMSVKESKCVQGASKDDYKYYQDIVRVFETVLERQPTTQEMTYYHNKFVTGTMDESKMRIVLTSSREFDILTMNQQNVVQAPLTGAMTTRQMEMIVNEIYTKVYNASPDPPAFKFVMSKLVEFHADEQKLLLFLKNLKRLEDVAQKDPIEAGSLTGVDPMWAVAGIQEKKICIDDLTSTPTLASRLLEKPQFDSYNSLSLNVDPVTISSDVLSFNNDFTPIQPQSVTGINRIDALGNVMGTVETFTQLKTFQAPAETSYIQLPLENKSHLPHIRVLKELDPVSIVYEDKPILGNATALMKQSADRLFDKDALGEALEVTLESELAYAPFLNNRNINERNYDVLRQYDSVTTYEDLWDDRFNVFAPLGYQNKKQITNTASDPLIPVRST